MKEKKQELIINLIACVNEKDALGKNGELLYRITHDFEWFKTVTKGQIVVMGVNTYREIGRPLPNRLNIVICDKNRPKPEVAEGVIVAHHLDDVRLIAGFEQKHEIFVIGGEKLYKEAFAEGVDYIYRTFVKDDTEGDVHFVSTTDIVNAYRMENDGGMFFAGINRITGKEVQYRFEIWKKKANSQSEIAHDWLNEQKGRAVNGLAGD